MTTLLFVGGLGPTELIIVFGIALLLFGAQKLPRLARASGEAMGEFQKGRLQVEEEIREMTRVERSEGDGPEDDPDAVTEPAESTGA